MTFCNLPPAPPLSGGLRPLCLLICFNWKPERSSFFLCFCSLCRTERRRKIFLSVFPVGSETVPALLVRVRSKRRSGTRGKEEGEKLGNRTQRGRFQLSSLFGKPNRDFSKLGTKLASFSKPRSALRADRVRSKTPPYPPRGNEKKFRARVPFNAPAAREARRPWGCGRTYASCPGWPSHSP